MLNVHMLEDFEDEILTALRKLTSGQLGAAGLDVWHNYPSDDAARTNTPPSQYSFVNLTT